MIFFSTIIYKRIFSLRTPLVALLAFLAVSLHAHPSYMPEFDPVIFAPGLLEASADTIPLQKQAYGGEELVADIDFPEDLAVMTAQAVTEELQTFDFDGKERLVTVSDYYSVLTAPFDGMVTTLTDLDNGERTWNWVRDARDLDLELSWEQPHKQYLHVGFSFLGIGETYKYTIECRIDELTEDTFKYRWTLLESYDGKMFEVYGSWYMKKLDERNVFVRSFTRTGFAEPLKLQKHVTELFGSGYLIKSFDVLYKDAHTR